MTVRKIHTFVVNKLKNCYCGSFKTANLLFKLNLIYLVTSGEFMVLAVPLLWCSNKNVIQKQTPNLSCSPCIYEMSSHCCMFSYIKKAQHTGLESIHYKWTQQISDVWAWIKSTDVLWCCGVYLVLQSTDWCEVTVRFKRGLKHNLRLSN